MAKKLRCPTCEGTGKIALSVTNIVDLLKQLRQRKKLTIQQVAKKTELSQSYIRKLENSKSTNPSYYKISILLKCYGLEIALEK